MEEHTPDPAPAPSDSRAWLGVVAVALITAAVWAGVAFAASRGSSGSGLLPGASAQPAIGGDVASNAAPGRCPHSNGGGSGSSSGSPTTPAL